MDDFPLTHINLKNDAEYPLESVEEERKSQESHQNLQQEVAMEKPEMKKESKRKRAREIEAVVEDKTERPKKKAKGDKQ